MLFNTMQYFLFLPIVVFLYYVFPEKVRYIWLLAVSYYFYMQWNPLYIILMFVCTCLTYIGGRRIESLKDSKIGEAYQSRQKICLAVCITLNLCILGYFKYFSLGIGYLNRLLHAFHLHEVTWGQDILLPVGISFYTLQALGYLIDVYRGNIDAEKNFFKYALFVSFFPQLVAGPIERSKNLLMQLYESHSFHYDNLRKGVLLILYGLFLKMVIADRAAIIVNTVYGDSAAYPGFYVVVATLFFAIQIYCDFYGYSTIARGSALLMGIRLTDNFNAPYYSKSIREFWHRWHISLSEWFRDYLYIPLGGGKQSMAQKERNRMIVFAVSGFWHGASLAFIFWGILHGIYQVVEDAALKIKQFIVCKTAFTESNRFSGRFLRMLFTFLLISFAWLFFRAGSLRTSREVLASLFSTANFEIFFDGTLYELGVGRKEMNVLLVSIGCLFFIDWQKYQKRDTVAFILEQGGWFRYLLYAGLFFIILIYGCYGETYDAQQFIYFQF